LPFWSRVTDIGAGTRSHLKNSFRKHFSTSCAETEGFAVIKSTGTPPNASNERRESVARLPSPDDGLRPLDAKNASIVVTTVSGLRFSLKHYAQ
jgi:hypothetical protein